MLKWNDTQSYTTIDELIKKIDVTTYDKTIHFNEQQMLENENSKKAKRDMKSAEKYHSYQFARFWKVLVEELQDLTQFAPPLPPLTG